MESAEVGVELMLRVSCGPAGEGLSNHSFSSDADHSGGTMYIYVFVVVIRLRLSDWVLLCWVRRAK